jgi:tetratricopeptide (TPR) repeat protein
MIDWSYNLLSREEKLLLCRLSVFVGSWNLEAAEQVCAGSSDISSSDVLDLLIHLVDKSLVILDESRYRMLETTRQYAREKLLDLDEGKMLRERHAAYFLDFAEKAEQEIHGTNQVYWMDQFEMDEDNIRAALDWCITKNNTGAALHLLGAWARTGRHIFSEILSWFVRIKALPDIRDHPALYAKLLNYVGRRIYLRGDVRYGASLIEESQALWLKLGAEGELGLAETLDILGEMGHGDKTSQSFFEESLKIYQKHGNDWGIGRVLYGLGSKAMWDRDYVEAQKQFMKSLTKFQKLGDQIEVARVLIIQGELARLQDDYERARKCYEQAIEICQEAHFRSFKSSIFINLVWVFLHEEDDQGAKVLLKKTCELSKEDANDDYAIIDCLIGFASTLGLTGKPEQAAWLFSASKHLLEGLSLSLDPSDQKEFDHYLAFVRVQLDETAFAQAWDEGSAMTIEQAITFALKETDE